MNLFDITNLQVTTAEDFQTLLSTPDLRIERIVTLVSRDTTVLTRDILPHEFLVEFENLSASEDLKPPTGETLGDRLKHVEEQIIRRTLEDNDWKQRKSARILGISESTLRYKMDKFSIARPSANVQ